jgi:hypothetical protein
MIILFWLHVGLGLAAASVPRAGMLLTLAPVRQ